MNLNDKKDVEQWIREEIRKFMSSPENTFNEATGEPAFAEPIVGFSSGADPLFEFYKKDIGDFYLRPIDFFANKYPELKMLPEQLTVISWILPQTERTKKDHRRETHLPSERWTRARFYGEKVNVKLRRHVVKILEDAGFKALAPMLSPIWKRAVSEKYGFASTWSERHAAYASGLGSFGLSDGLITPVGKAMRTGSVIANINVEPTERPYKDHNAYCLFLSKGRCGECIKRCPIGAITLDGHDKVLCSNYVDMTKQYVKRHYGFEGYGCGFCQTGVPCESGIPE
jgi:epoxyqueuosine reductase QueG